VGNVGRTVMGIEGPPDDPDLKIDQTKNAVRLVVAGVLGRTGQRRRRSLMDRHLNPWLADAGDIGMNW
jgi:hypothetical protein